MCIRDSWGSGCRRAGDEQRARLWIWSYFYGARAFSQRGEHERPKVRAAIARHGRGRHRHGVARDQHTGRREAIEPATKHTGAPVVAVDITSSTVREAGLLIEHGDAGAAGNLSRRRVKCPAVYAENLRKGIGMEHGPTVGREGKTVRYAIACGLALDLAVPGQPVE